MYSIRKNESDMEKMSDDSSDLSVVSGETRLTVNVQQISSRFQSMQVAAKEILKKCEQAVNDHRHYVDKYNDSSEWLVSAKDKLAACLSGGSGGGSGGVEADSDLAAIETKLAVLEQLLADQQQSISNLNRVLEMGEKLYATTAAEGRDAVRVQMQELQAAIDSFYDGASSSERQLQAKRSKSVLAIHIQPDCLNFPLLKNSPPHPFYLKNK